MALHHPASPDPHHHRTRHRPVHISPLYTQQPLRIPKTEFPAGSLDPDVAYQIVHDELMLDGNARLNLATFVSEEAAFTHGTSART